MENSSSGSFRLFRIAGIDVFLHWTWLLMAFYEVQIRVNHYQSQAWMVAEYLTLFGIVLLHEFGHALACRQVGGTADRIVLWPLGGIAYVRPPVRPGAVLWSIAAGPLVNLLLVPVTVGLFLLAHSQEWSFDAPDAYHFCFAIMVINGILLIFNLLPIYPLDGGQILQALLWFLIGRARSLLVVSVIGMVVGAGALVFAAWKQDWWFVVLAAFVALRSWAGFNQARLLSRLLSGPRHEEAACPSCGMAPLAGEFWVCSQCRTKFDTFAQRATCPSCGAQFSQTTCIDCQRSHPIVEWFPKEPVRSDVEEVEPI
jgi:Zn-dependent protease